MPTTSNFGWTTPADTDLVKDGALAIRTLGNGVDTSFVDLKGGTTGQVLSKTSNTDLDFTWVTTDDANAIQNAIVDAKGDLIAASAADTPARLPVGSNGQVLIAASGETTGLKWGVDPTTDVVTTAGDLIYGTAADTVARLGIGTAGQVLQVNSGATAPEWAAPASGGMTLLSTTTFSGSSITVSSISQDYKDLVGVIVDLYTNNTGNGTYIRLNGDTGSNYAYSGVRNIGATVSAQFSLSDTKIILTPRSATSNTDKKKTFGTFTIPRYTESHNKVIVNRTNGSDETDAVSMHNVGMWDDTTAVSSLVLFADYTFSGGTLYLYGVK